MTPHSGTLTPIAQTRNYMRKVFSGKRKPFTSSKGSVASDVYKVLRQEYPSNNTAINEFNRAIARLLEEKRGKYNFKHMQQEVVKKSPPLFDHATYVGPVVVRTTESRGRGLFTTKDIKAGDLLLCKKAFAHAFYDPEDSEKGLALLINVETDLMTIGTQADLLTILVQKLYKNPSLMSTITNLHHGSYNPVGVSEVDDTPIVDTFLIERIMALNCFSCPLSSLETHIRSSTDKAEATRAGNEFHSCGVWPLASYINHSCDSNAQRSFNGDMMIVRATRDITRDSEITFWYKSPWGDEVEFETR
ncbi:hypothetical protein BDV12DRAFT_204185 [Aspergillus spectabilis]